MTMLDLTPSQRILHEQHKARQSRFYLASPAKPYSPPADKVKEAAIAAKKAMNYYVGLVAEAYGLTSDDILAGAPTSVIIQARRLAIAVTIRWGGFSKASVSSHFGLDVGLVADAAGDLYQILRQQMISTNTPVAVVLPLIVQEWSDYKGGKCDPAIIDIQRAVSRHFGIALNDMRSQTRGQPIARYRQFAMALCRRLTLLSLPTIGMKFGGRDHTTAMHAARRFEPLIANLNKRLDDSASLEKWVQALAEEMKLTPLARGKCK